MIARSVLMLSVVGVLAGCDTTGVTNTAATNYATISPELSAQGQPIALVDQLPAGSKTFPVEATACQYENYDPLPNDAYALALLKAEAAKQGAHTLANVTYQHLNVDIPKNCFTTIIAKGLASD